MADVGMSRFVDLPERVSWLMVLYEVANPSAGASAVSITMIHNVLIRLDGVVFTLSVMEQRQINTKLMKK